MKKNNSNLLNVLIIFILCVISSTLYTQSRPVMNFYSGGHDSLLFDAGSANSYLRDNPCGCKIKILKQSGFTYGSWCEKRTGETCGEKDTFYIKMSGLIPSFLNEITDGDTIKVGDFPDCEIDLQLNDGKKIAMSRNSSMLIAKDHCTTPISLLLYQGIIYLDFTNGDKGKSVGIRTERGEVINQGTRFSVEIAEREGVLIDIIKVYEGSVTVAPNTENEAYQKKISGSGDKIAGLYSDYQSGKISNEEFTNKMKQYSEGITSVQPKIVTVTAGYISMIKGPDNPTDPVPFETSDDPGLIK